MQPRCACEPPLRAGAPLEIIDLRAAGGGYGSSGSLWGVARKKGARGPDAPACVCLLASRAILAAVIVLRV